MLPKPLFVAGSFCVTCMFLEVPFASAACVSGRTTDLSGIALADASVTAYRTDGSSFRQGVTGRDGTFQICDLASGEYAMTVRLSGFTSDTRSETVADTASRPLEIRLAREVASSAVPDIGSSVPTFEFRNVLHAAATTIPDAPASSRSLRDTLHGQANALWGSGLVGEPSVPAFSQFPLADFGASIGGDLSSARTSFFASFDQFGTDPQRLLAAVAAAQSRTAKPFSVANSNIVTFSSFNARLDHRFSDRDAAYASLRGGDASSSLPGRGADGAPKLVNTRSTKQVGATAANTIDLSPSTVNETRASFVSSEVQLPPGTVDGSIVSGLPTVHRDRVFDAANNVYRQIGGQNLRFGGDFLYNQMSVSFLESMLGRTSDSISQSRRSGSLYVQSARRVRPNLLLTSGLGYQIQPLKGFKTDTGNLAPQVGFAWSPSSRTVIRGGAAVYYDQVPLPALAASSDENSPANLQSSANFASSSGSQAVPMTFFTVMSPLLQNSYVETASFGVEQQVSAHTFISSDYQFARGL